MVLSCGIYRFVWYHRINRELSSANGRDVQAWGQWWSQLIPFYNLYAIWKTCDALNQAHAAVGSQVRVSPFVGAILAPCWFGSDVRYIQRRVNTLGDIHHTHAVAAIQAAAMRNTLD